MKQNPYDATSITSQTRPTRWMIVAGSVSLGLAAVCLLITAMMMMWTFSALAEPNTAPQPSELASGFSNAVISSFAVGPLGLLGIVFLILGFVRRQPISSVLPHNLKEQA